MKKTLLKISFITASAISLVGCKKFVDVNTNPNAATSSNALYVMSGAVGTTYRNQVSGVLHITPSTWTGFNAHSTSFTGGGSEKTYSITSSDFNAFGLYDNIADYEYIINNSDKDGAGFLKDPANVMECYVYQELVDLYGDIPYTEAMKGDKNITPKYDKQKDIYEDLIKRLDAAITSMVAATWPTDVSITVFDNLFKGNKDKWIRFANTLKLRILMRQSFMPGRDAYITTNINSTLARGYLNENVLVSPGYQVVAGKLNPFYANYGFNELNNVVSNHQYRKTNAVLINWLKTSATTNILPPTATVSATANADTFRLQSLAWPSGTTVTAASANLNTYVGIPLGIGAGYATANSSPIGPIQTQQGQGTRAGMLMLLAECRLLQAEAAQRYGIAFGSTAQQLYEQGILAHFRTCAAPSTAGNAANTGDAFAIRYYNRAIENVGWVASTDKIRAILIQKWVSLTHINGLEAWSEYRKSSGSASEGVPSKVRTLASTSNPEPTRYVYPLVEEQANSANVPTTGNTTFTKLFWDVN